MARLYANENFPKQIVDELLSHYGRDVLTTLGAGNANRSITDEEVLAFASSERRILLTHNRRHFLALHRKSPNHTGIIVCTFDPDFSGQARRIHEALSGQSEMQGKIIRVNRPAAE